MRGDLKEANEGRQKAGVEAAELRVEVEALRRMRDDLQQRMGVAEAQVRSRWLQGSRSIAIGMHHHGSHGVASKLYAPRGMGPWPFTPICVMGHPWR